MTSHEWWFRAPLGSRRRWAAGMSAAPACAHAEACGGCAHQGEALAALADRKRNFIVAALRRRGLEPEVKPTLSAPPNSRRRARFAAVRSKKGAIVGFYRPKSEEIVELSECLVVTPTLFAALEPLRALARLAAPRARAIAITVVETDTGLDVSLGDAKPIDLPAREAAAAWADAADVARLAWNDEVIAERRAPQLRVGRAELSPPPGAFLQPTRFGEAALAAAAAEGVGDAKHVADLFAGSGTFALRLAERAEVLAVEGEAAQVAALDRAWRRADGLKRVVAVKRDLFRRPLRAEELKHVEAVVIDPPRQGAEAQARELAAWDGGRIVSISCDPASFARDAAILVAGGWRLGPVQPIDQFLWSDHVELVANLRRDA